MKLGQIAFLFLVFGILKFMIITTFFGTAGTYTVGNFTVPDFPNVVICFDGDGQTGCDVTFYHFAPGGCDLFDFTCSSVAQATQNVAIGIINMFVAIYVAILFLIRLLIYIVQMIIFVGSLLFSTIPDAPWYVNLMILTPILIIFGIIIYRLFRSGHDSA